MKKNDKKTETLKLIPKEMHGNGLDIKTDKLDIEKYLKEFELIK